MRVRIQVPQPEGVRGEAATIVKWLKEEGDEVKRDEPILVLEYPKADFEVPAPASGRLTSILAREGQMVRINDEVGFIDSPDATS